MNLYPAIDLFDGKVVRLSRGDYNAMKVYSENPAEIATKWAEQGAQWLHLVDLEGAKEGKVVNEEAVRSIREAVDCSIEFGGGLRHEETIEAVLSWGIDRVIIGTRALDGDFIQSLLEKFGSKIALGIDVRNGIVQTQGWLQDDGATLEDALEWIDKFGVETIIYTDISKDGMLQGPNFDGLEKVLGSTKAGVILSGGVSELVDIERCSKITASNFEGVIMGKAIYENRFSVQDAFDVVQSQ